MTNRTLFTPVQTGLYRLSIYLTVTKPDLSVFAGDLLPLVSWTDDAGAELSGSGIFNLTSRAQPPESYGGPLVQSWPGQVMTFEAVAGSPVVFDLRDNDNPPEPDNARYSLYYVVEKLE